jgi:hypothetical protein
MAKPLNGNDLAIVLYNVLPQHTDAYGKTLPIPSQLKKYGLGIVASLKAATVANLLGTITGVAAAGQQLSNGLGTKGKITITADAMIAITKLKPPVAEYEAENKAIIKYIGTGLVEFPVGSITGKCTNTSSSPGPLTGGAGARGKITGLTAKGAVEVVEAAMGSKLGPDMEVYYGALVDYIQKTAVVAYATGKVTGTCPSGGGPLAAGAATVGKIT